MLVVFGQADLNHADVILLLATERRQRQLDFLEQCLRLTIGVQKLEQARLAE